MLQMVSYKMGNFHKKKRTKQILPLGEKGKTPLKTGPFLASRRDKLIKIRIFESEIIATLYG